MIGKHERGPFPCGIAAVAGLLAWAAVAQPAEPPGADKSPKTRVLEAGAKALQRSAPLAPMDVYLVGFHPLKDHPEHQMEAHHFCRQVNEDFAQCVLFDGNTAEARLNGIEYIISEKLLERLPVEERRFWHPHNAEILSGQLVAPGIPDAADKALMKSKLNSYGKTWHVWNTGAMGDAGDPLPMGPAMLAWSFNRDGEARPGLVEGRDRRMHIDSDEKRRQRADLQHFAKPQSGVDALRAAFPGARPIPGVAERQQVPGPAPVQAPGERPAQAVER